MHHPLRFTLNASLSRLDWSDYTEKLCTKGEGYTGPYCGACRPGFGATAPFHCQRCLGVGVTASGATGHPSKIGISLVYVAYWILFTGITLYSVWSAFSAQHKEQKDNTHASTSSHKQPSTNKDIEAVRDQDLCDLTNNKAVRDQDRSKTDTPSDGSSSHKQPSPSSDVKAVRDQDRSKGNTSPAKPPPTPSTPTPSSPMDIIKVGYGLGFKP